MSLSSQNCEEDNRLVIDESNGSTPEVTPKKKIETESERSNTGKATPSKPKAKPKPVSKPSKPAKKNVHCFRHTIIKDPKTMLLYVSATPQTFYNMQLDASSELLIAEMPKEDQAAPKAPDVTLEQLLFWPDISVKITLPDITFTRCLASNVDRAIVIGDDENINLDKTPNVTEIRGIKKVVTNKTNGSISKEMFDVYISAIEQAATLVDISRTRLPEIQCIFQRIKRDMELLPCIQVKSEYSRFPNKYKYKRYFDNTTEKSETEGRAKAVLREVINPEIIFDIERCNFQTEKLTEWEKDLCEYMENIFVKRQPAQLNTIKEIMKKCITIKCTICHETFDNALCMISAKAHLSKHFHDKHWQCFECKKSFSQVDLCLMGWAHECSSNN